MTDQVITGGIEGYKFGSESLIRRIMRFVFGSNNPIKPPLEGVEITATSRTTGKAYSAVTDKKGYFKISDLPYDTYMISETKGVEGYRLFEPFEVTIEEDGYYFHYLLEDEIIKNKLQVVKVDAETGKTIPRAGAEFKIWDTWANEYAGDWVEMTKPNSLDKTDVFETNSEGYLVTTEALPYGIDRYKLHEIKAPEGYVRQKEPIIFSVDTDSNDEVIQIRFENASQKGQVHLHKTVETGTTVTEKESEYGTYQEIAFTQQNGEGFEFKIRPTEDIVTPDGTLYYEAGKYLQENGNDYVLKTDEQGKGTSPAFLYMGKYEAIETSAPSGVVMAKDPIPFEITYAGQDLALTSTSVAVENTLQMVEIYGHKKQEVVSDWDGGEAVIELEEAKNGQVFALRLAQEVTVGEIVLPEDTTLAYAVVEEGLVSFKEMKLPNQEIKLYLQEVNAGDEHVLDDTKYPFTYTPSNNDDTQEINVWANGVAYGKQALTRIAREPLVNRLARQEVELIKRDRLNEKPLEQVPFTLYTLSENGEETAIGTYYTNAEGKINVSDLPTGTYRFKENEPLEGYFPLEDPLDFEVTVENNGQKIVLEAYNEREPLEITTLFASVDGKKELDPTIDNRLKDTVWIKGAALEVGHTYTVVTKYKDTKTGEVVSEDTSTYTAKSKDDRFDVFLDLKANTMKHNGQLTATHTLYYEEKQENEVAKEDDLKNTNQTVTFKTPKVLPKTGATTSIYLTVAGLFLFVLGSILLFQRKRNV